MVGGAALGSLNGLTPDPAVAVPHVGALGRRARNHFGGQADGQDPQGHTGLDRWNWGKKASPSLESAPYTRAQ